MPPHHNYVRRNRKRHALSADELAALLGGNSHSFIARIERGIREPAFDTALGLQVIFGFAPAELFPDLFARIEDAVMARAADLNRSLEGKVDPASEAKRRLLFAMIERAKAASRAT